MFPDSSTTQAHNTYSSKTRAIVVLICFAAIVFDGYDLIIYGSTVPSLLAYKQWSLSPAEVGAIGSYALLGMFFGAISAGPLSDKFGRRRLFIACLSLYSVAMIAVALAPSPAALGLFRFIAGLGFGGIAPVAIALVVEVARPHERHRLNAMMLAGLPVGGVLAALAALSFLDTVGFRGLWAFGAIALVTVVPLAWRFIPDTDRATTAPGASTRAVPLRHLLQRNELVALLLFAVANFVGFLLVFGLNMWLPVLMQKAGYALGSALAFLLLLNLGAVAGGLIGSALSDRFGGRRVAPWAFLLATISVGVMASAPPTAVLAVFTVTAGAGSIGTQIIVFGYVATYYETAVRATALGISTGIGRLGAVSGPTVGGFLVSSGLGNAYTFGFFGAMALVGGIACLMVPARSKTSSAVAPMAASSLSRT